MGTARQSRISAELLDALIAGVHDTAATPATLRIEGATADDQLGSSLSILDLDGDDLLEIAAGAPTAKRPDDLTPRASRVGAQSWGRLKALYR